MPIHSISISLALIALLTWPQPAARGADSGGRFQVFGAGLVDCAAFIQTQHDPAARAGFDIWIAGYVTALNRTTADTWSLLADPHPPQVFAWLDDFCREHETALFAKAVHEMLTAFFRGRIVEAPR
jgi:hypothetical protein